MNEIEPTIDVTTDRSTRMNRSRARWVVALVLAFGLLAAACGSDSGSTNKGNGNGTSSTTKPAPPLAAATLAGSGATFPQAYYESVISEFKTAQPAVTVTYGGGGSGKGQSDLQAGLVQWAGSDSTVKPEDMAKYKGPFLYFPTVAAPITVSYNLSSVKGLQLAPETLAKIFSGQIKTWNDAAIAADNPKATLPATAITVVHRADGSGTTANFTAYLVKAAGSSWTLGTDKVVNWPTGQQAGTANAGVAQIVKDTDGAIGYVDYSDAKAAGLVFAAVKNASGKYVAPSIDSATAALAGATVNANLTYDPLNASGADAYPITAPTYILIYTAQSDANVAAALKGFMNYIYGAGQDLAPTVDFAPLPSDLLSKAKAQVAQIGS
jgi:phosphate transport system substrate-binding protein